MNTVIRWASVLAVVCCGWAGTTTAASIAYDVQNVGGSQWRYDYHVSNDDPAAPVTWFTLFFDRNLYTLLCGSATGSCLVGPDAPAGWDPLVQQPDPGLPDDGLLDLFTPGAGIAPGETLGGFSIVFDWLGAGSPGSQSFDVIGEDPASPLQSGWTVARQVAGVSEPGTVVLLGLGLGLVCFAAGRRRERRVLA